MNTNLESLGPRTVRGRSSRKGAAASSATTSCWRSSSATARSGRERAWRGQPDARRSRRHARPDATPAATAGAGAGHRPRAGEPRPGRDRARPAHAVSHATRARSSCDRSDIALYLLPRFGAHPVERFGVVMLDTRRRLIRPAHLRRLARRQRRPIRARSFARPRRAAPRPSSSFTITRRAIRHPAWTT